MNGKVIFYLCVLLAVIGVSYSIFYSMEVDEAIRELELVKPQVQTLENGIDSLKAQLESAKPQIENRQQAKALIAASAVLATEKETIRSEIATLEEREADLANQLAQMVKRVRERSIGQSLGGVPLSTGRFLKDCLLKSVDDEVMTVSYSEGIAKVPVTELPKDLKDRFMVGIKVKVKVVEEPSVVIPPPSAKPEQKQSAPKHTAIPRGNPRIEGDPSLWGLVTRTSLGRAYIPGRGWLKIGTKGPITTTAYGEPEHP
jgi:hypothetical protein